MAPTTLLETPPAQAPAAPRLSLGKSREVWRIGSMIAIQGELTADTDVAIDGHFFGRLNLDGHRLSLGAGCDVRAEVRAGAVVIRGRFHGNIVATERVSIAKTAVVTGSIRAPRVKLDPGASVRGRIDTDR